MPGVYGGDDVSAIVIDPGSSLLRAGWAGEDTPRVIIPSSYGWIYDESPENADVAASTSTTAASEAEVKKRNAMDTTEDRAPTSADRGAQANGADASTSEVNDSRSRVAKYLAKKEEGHGKFKKRFFGDAGVNQWRRGMEISPTVVDGVGE